jgi:GrpB-like predicted nucleotidyltransferase (UPF0157 family)
VIVEYDDTWPAEFARQERRIRGALDGLEVEVHHAGSTSVPGLAAKPTIDVVLVVPDAGDEAAYAAALQETGYVFTHREPEWYEHRMFKDRSRLPRINLHVFPAGCEEVERMLAFRDRLRSDADDRAAYERTKRELAERTWATVMDYAAAKSGVVGEILGRARPDLVPPGG